MAFSSTHIYKKDGLFGFVILEGTKKPLSHRIPFEPVSSVQLDTCHAYIEAFGFCWVLIKPLKEG